MDNLQVRVWEAAEWRASRGTVDALLASSTADPLFNSWTWLDLWWTHFGNPQAGECLKVYAVYDGTSLVGLLPTVEGIRSRRRMLHITATAALGGYLLDDRGVPTEYHDVIATSGTEQAVREAVMRHLVGRRRGSEFSLTCAVEIAGWERACRAATNSMWMHIRRLDAMRAYQADLSSGFQPYLATLSGNARRTIYNQRKRLLELGEVEVEDVPLSRLDDAFEELNALHALRWGQPAFEGRRLDFHRALARELHTAGKVRMSRLRIGPRTASVLYDLRAGSTQYNIQMGFVPDLISSASLGILHIGYSMESAALDGVRTYDFLAGTGRNTDYKQRYSSSVRELHSIQVLLGAVASSVFRVYDKFNMMRTRHDST